MSTVTLYHGSEVVVSEPSLDRCRANNDYGVGFYCTEDMELSKEWACKHDNDGFSNKYHLIIDDLKVLDLTDETHTTLEWISLLVKNRKFDLASESPAYESREYLLSNHLIDITTYDVIIGYRADDSYFSYAQAFLDNTMSLEALEEAMMLGKLGKQVALMSDKALDNLTFVGSEKVPKKVYGEKYRQRDSEARHGLRTVRKHFMDGTFIIQIMRDGA